MFESRRPLTVAICGGGLAGLTLARQLRQSDTSSRIVVLDREPDPLPVAAHKVGESSVELGAHYFGNHLHLEEYLREAQLPKFGLRYFLGPATDDLSTRLEFGPQSFPPVPSLQLDRGRLENDLRAFNRADGIEVCTGVSVRDIELGADDNPHVITTDDPALGSIRADWVIDATGRRRIIQNRLGLSKPSGHEASAAWWRVPGIRKVNDMLGAVGRKPWESRLQEKRWLSTNHIMGRGYWVWFIPLSSGNTSIGIVTDETIHPLRTYNTHEKAMAWLRAHEPAVAKFIENDPLLDFKILKRYSYWSEQVLSSGRWACVGEAGIFSDPFYSPGSDSIAWANTFASKMISKWGRGELEQSYVDRLNRTLLEDLGEITNAYYRGTYNVFGSPRVMVVKVLWDTCLYWGFPCQLFFQRHLEADALEEYGRIAARLRPLNQRVQDLFRAWADCPGMDAIDGGRFVAYSSMPLFRQLQMDLTRKKSQDEMFSEMWSYLPRLEEWAQVLFHAAIKDAGIEASFPGEPECPVNPLAIGLDPGRWDEDGLLDVPNDATSLTEMADQTKYHIFRPIES